MLDFMISVKKRAQFAFNLFLYLAISARTWGAPARRPKISEFVCTPKAVALPKYLLQDYPQTFNYDDLPEVRQKVIV